MQQQNNTDISESAEDKKRLKPDTAILDLPEVKDIPGQENFKVAPIGILRDGTASSADEEGEGILDFDDEDDLEDDDETNVSATEKDLLDDAANHMSTEDEKGLQEAALDKADDDGEPLNEDNLSDDISGDDLDVPGSNDDDADEEIGEEDEENNTYSQSDTD